ncbi:hypothetical protein ACFW6F_36445 [Streptomyces sp. NPDC058746]|uniref:hypothetical protein n=1 Tax=Streptomyces sp. NPDC058746 TaxID=3346622 RepID=UPI00368E74E6
MPSDLPSGPGPLREHWLRGIAAHPAAPPDVLVRLLDPAAREAWTALCGERDLPPAVVEAVLAHPERSVRRAFAQNPHADPAQRGRLAHDPHTLVRAWLAGGPRPRTGRVRPLPDAALEVLLAAQDDPDGDFHITANEIRQELESSGQIPMPFRRRLPEHRDPALRAYATYSWESLAPEQHAALLADPDPTVREAALRAAQRASRERDPEALEAELPEQDGHARQHLLMNRPVSRAVVEACLAEGRNLYELAYNRDAPADAVARLARDPDPEVRAAVAARADTGPALLAELAEDPDERVRTRARIHPLPRTWAQRDVLDHAVFHSFGCACAIVDGYLEQEGDWYSDCARSEHEPLRRIAATYRLLPGELVELLAADPAAEVRRALACHHPLAPPALVLDTFLTSPGQRPHLLTLPTLPRTGLGHLLGHEDAEVRALAAADVTLAQAPVRLLSDPEAVVRRAAAANPLLPAALLAALLEDPATAEGAAANPGLSAARLHELLDRLGVPG